LLLLASTHSMVQFVCLFDMSLLTNCIQINKYPGPKPRHYCKWCSGKIDARNYHQRLSPRSRAVRTHSSCDRERDHHVIESAITLSDSVDFLRFPPTYMLSSQSIFFSPRLRESTCRPCECTYVCKYVCV
jgi:hypothetical protein